MCQWLRNFVLLYSKSFWQDDTGNFILSQYTWCAFFHQLPFSRECEAGDPCLRPLAPSNRARWRNHGDGNPRSPNSPEGGSLKIGCYVYSKLWSLHAMHLIFATLFFFYYITLLLRVSSAIAWGRAMVSPGEGRHWCFPAPVRPGFGGTTEPLHRKCNRISVIDFLWRFFLLTTVRFFM